MNVIRLTIVISMGTPQNPVDLKRTSVSNTKTSSPLAGSVSFVLLSSSSSVFGSDFDFP